MRQARAISSSSSSSIIGGSCHKYHFCRDNSFVATNTSGQKTCFVATKLCFRDIIMFVATNVCRDMFCHHKNILSWRTYFFSRQNFCHDKHTFVATKHAFCRDKSFVATKLILVTAPANDTPQYCWKRSCWKKQTNKCPCSYSYSLSGFLCCLRPLGFLLSKGGRS